MKRFIVLAFILSVFAGACGGGGGDTPPPQATGTIRLHNSSGVTIDYFYLSPTSQSSWGPDQLSTPLPTGYYYDIWDVPAGTYDARAEVIGVYSIYYGYLYNFTVPADAIYDLYAYSSSFTGSLKVVNNTLNAYILELYVSPCSASDWGVNQLSSNIVPSAYIHLYDIDTGCYDIAVVWDIGPDSYYYSEAITSLTLLTLNAS